MQLFQLFLGDRRGRPGHQIGGALALGEGNHLPDVGLAGQQHHQTVNARRDAAVRRRAVLKRLQHVPELLFGILHFQPDELEDLDYSVDVLTTPEPVKSTDQLDPKRYGAIVECGWRRGLLLPDLEGVDTVDYQIDICCQKGGIMPGEPIKLYRFEVKRYK